MTKISAKIVADSINIQGDRITTMMLTFPRFILAELNTHRMFSKNSASSRAIPFNKMVESVENDPFIPIAWQKEHKGMQGNDYFKSPYEVAERQTTWLISRDEAVKEAKNLHKLGVTKQLANRQLEPFMWHTVILTATEFDNFFELRCPQYEFEGKFYKSKKDAIVEIEKVLGESDFNDLQDYYQWASINHGDAEIHMMALAEAMRDARNESTPKLLQPGEWHIPFEDKINDDSKYLDEYWTSLFPDLDDIPEKVGVEYNNWLINQKLKISTAMAARVSYTTVGDEKEFTHEKQIELHNRMINQVPFHASPFEHNARAMTEEEYYSLIRGRIKLHNISGSIATEQSMYGWCRNFKGFIQYRELIENK